MGSTVTTVVGSTLIVQAGFKWRKLNSEQVREWTEIPSDADNRRISAVSQAVTGAVLPRFVGKAASAAVGAAIDTTIRPSHKVQIDWIDGKRSLVKLPDDLFVHFELMLRDLQVRETIETADTSTRSAVAVIATSQAEAPTIAAQALTHLSDILKDRLPRASDWTPVGIEAAPVAPDEVADQLTKLAALRDAGVLTDAEFTAKKTELLARL